MSLSTRSIRLGSTMLSTFRNRRVLGPAKVTLDHKTRWPRASVLWRDIPGFDNAYGPNWRDRYYSDARGRFDYGDPEDHADGEPIQVNLHPEHWRMWKNGDFLSPAPRTIAPGFEPFFREPIWIPERSPG